MKRKYLVSYKYSTDNASLLLAESPQEAAVNGAKALGLSINNPRYEAVEIDQRRYLETHHSGEFAIYVQAGPSFHRIGQVEVQLVGGEPDEVA